MDKCNGNCMDCNIYQRQYCASQISYTNMRELEKMAAVLDGLQHKVDDLGEKIAAIQNNEASLINPVET